MGEIIRIRTEGKRTEIRSPAPDANAMEEEENSSMLSDDELDELLFGDWFEDDLIDQILNEICEDIFNKTFLNW